MGKHPKEKEVVLMANIKTVQLPVYEYELLRTMAKAEGLSTQAYLRNKIRKDAKELHLVVEPRTL